MAKEEKLILKAKVLEALPMGLFKVKITHENAQDFGEILCHLGGKLRTSNIRVLIGDEVDVEVSPYDLKKGRITYRHTGSKKTGPIEQGDNLDADAEVAI